MWNETNFNENWRFRLGDMEYGAQTDLDDTLWQEVSLPHDYAIEGPYSFDHDKQEISLNQQENIVFVGRTGALPVDKGAWYRKKIQIKAGTSHVFLEFDGIMSHSTIYVNGILCGGRISGYSSFSVEVSHACQVGLNIVAVRVSPENSSSQWYTGAGIYREARLVEKKDSYFPYLAGFISPEVKGRDAYIACHLKIENPSGCQLLCSVSNREGKVLQRIKTADIPSEFSHIFKLNGFVSWNLYDSYLYRFQAVLYKNNVPVDQYETTFGIRTLEFDKNDGFLLNHKKMKLKGVCLHHDLGALGAAFSVSAARRQLEKLIEIGVNAIRCVYNPPSPKFLDICDELGLLVIDEAFDEWKSQKLPNSYGKHFDSEAEKDLISMLHRDRNHPSVILWSIGNEVLEENQENGWIFAKFLSDICHREDSSRLVTAGIANPSNAIKNGLCDYIDVVGLQCCPSSYQSFHEKYPDMIFYASETSRSISSRGEYEATWTVPESIPQKKDNLQINSTDFQSGGKGYYPEREFSFQDKCDFILGEFVWTGFDYMGDPYPYITEWPARSSYFGIFDTAGLAKDRAFSYQSRWTDKEFIHLFPHWTWADGDEITMQCYSNFDEIELFVNGISMGISMKLFDDEVLSHRHIWKNVPYFSGEVKAIAVRKPSVFASHQTAKEPIRLRLEPEKKKILVNGTSLVYVKCSVIDEHGVICPNAAYKVDFTVSGVGEYVASDSGDPTDTWIFSKPYCKTFHGHCIAIIRSKSGETGEIQLTVTSDYLLHDSCSIVAVGDDATEEE